MSQKVNIHFENIVVEGFTRQESNLIVKNIKSSLETKLSNRSTPYKQSGFMTNIQAPSITVNPNMKPKEIGQKAADSIYKSIYK